MNKKLKKFIGHSLPAGSTVKRWVRQVHLWLGLASGLVVFILGITGCLYVFEEELRPLVYDYHFVDEAKGEALPLSELLILANDTLTGITQKPATFIKVNSENEHTVLFRSFERDTAATGIWYWDEMEIMDAYVNPYNGEVVEIENFNFEFFRVVMMLHWSLLLKNDIGQPIIGWATVIFVIMLITGLVLWWPRNKRAAKQRFWFKWRSTTRWKRKNYDLHNILGFYSLFLVLFIALTGLVWAFDWFEDSVKWVANGGKTIESVQETRISDTTQSTNNKLLDKIYAEVKEQHPAAASYFILLPQDSATAQRVFVNYEGRVDDLNLYFDQYTGALLGVDSWEEKNNGEKIRTLNYDIHAGGILGFPGKVLAFFLSLIAASLPVTGFLIWWGRRPKKKRRSKKKRSGSVNGREKSRKRRAQKEKTAEKSKE